MNYILEINAFYNVFLPQNPIPANAQALWHRLMAYCNAFYWQNDFAIASSLLIEQINFHTSDKAKDKANARKQALEHARNILIQKGLIRYKKGSGGQSGSYTMISLLIGTHISNHTGVDTSNDTGYHTGVDTCNNTSSDTGVDTGYHTGNEPLNKLNKSKEDNIILNVCDTRAYTHEEKAANDDNANAIRDGGSDGDDIGFDTRDYTMDLRECGDIYMHASGTAIPSAMAADIHMRIKSGIEVALIKEWILASAGKNNPATYFTRLAQSYHAKGIKTYVDYCKDKGIEIAKPKTEMTVEERRIAAGYPPYYSG